MSSDRETWENKFVDAFVVKSKRTRYKELLNKPKSRTKILDRLNHGDDLEFGRAVELVGRESLPEHFIQRLRAYEVDDHCWLISDDPQLDLKSLPISEAADLTARAFLGTVMICPPLPVAVFRPEASEGTLYLFS